MVTIGHFAEPFKVEMVIRGYLTGHAWREYKSGKRSICGVPMPEGMVRFVEKQPHVAMAQGVVIHSAGGPFESMTGIDPERFEATHQNPVRLLREASPSAIGRFALRASISALVIGGGVG